MAIALSGGRQPEGITRRSIPALPVVLERQPQRGHEVVPALDLDRSTGRPRPRTATFNPYRDGSHGLTSRPDGVGWASPRDWPEL